MALPVRLTCLAYQHNKTQIVHQILTMSLNRINIFYGDAILNGVSMKRLSIKLKGLALTDTSNFSFKVSFQFLCFV